MTFLPIVGRELRVASRRPASYWARFTSVGMAIVFAGFIYLSSMYSTTASRGTGLFYAISAFAFLYCHINSIANDYYSNKSFCRNSDGTINLWKLYNLFTNAAKSTYIDQFLERSVSASRLVEGIHGGLRDGSGSWFLN